MACSATLSPSTRYSSSVGIDVAPAACMRNGRVELSLVEVEGKPRWHPRNNGRGGYSSACSLADKNSQQ